MITCELMGGLGNQLFQIFAVLACAFRQNMRPMFQNIDTLHANCSTTTTRHTYWNTLLAGLQPYISNVKPHIDVHVSEMGFDYKPVGPFHPTQSVRLFGYFQSYKYFADQYPKIYQLLNIGQQRNHLLNRLQLNVEQTISLHFRLGDYVRFPKHHPILPAKYYHQSLNWIREKYPGQSFTVWYFCEPEDCNKTCVHELTQAFPEYTFQRMDGLSDWEEMLLMSGCHHNIIANSSFSWWAAYFNEHADKIVCYPSLWFGEALRHHNTSDLCPPTWKRISI